MDLRATILRFVLPVAAAASVGCTSAPLAGPAAGSATGGVAMRIRMALTDGQRRTFADKIHFVRLKPGQPPTQGNKFAASDRTRGNVVYAFSLEPGRYAPVACEEKRDGRTYTTYLPAESIERCVFVVEAGQLVSLGHLDLRLSPLGRKTDKAQAHYARFIGPNWAKATTAQLLFHRNRFHDGTAPTWRIHDESVRARIAKDAAGWPVVTPATRPGDAER